MSECCDLDYYIATDDQCSGLLAIKESMHETV